MENKRKVKLIPVKQRLRFREEDDLNLLREVAAQNPFETPSVWDNIKENVLILSQKNFSIKTLKDHLDLLIQAWLQKIKLLKDRSGIEETYNEKDQLCQNIHDYMLQFRNKPKKKNNASSQEKILGKSEREKWAKLAGNIESNTDNKENITEHFQLEDHNYFVNATNEEIAAKNTVPNLDIAESIATEALNTLHEHDSNSIITLTPVQSQVHRPVKTKKRKINIQRQGMSYLEKYDEQQRVLKETEYKLEERRIAVDERRCALEEARYALEDRRLSLQERKLELDYDMEKIKFNLEQDKQKADIEERKNLNNLLKKQTDFLEILVKQIK